MSFASHLLRILLGVGFSTIVTLLLAILCKLLGFRFTDAVPFFFAFSFYCIHMCLHHWPFDDDEDDEY